MLKIVIINLNCQTKILYYIIIKYINIMKTYSVVIVETKIVEVEAENLFDLEEKTKDLGDTIEYFNEKIKKEDLKIDIKIK